MGAHDDNNVYDSIIRSLTAVSFQDLKPIEQHVREAKEDAVLNRLESGPFITPGQQSEDQSLLFTV